MDYVFDGPWFDKEHKDESFDIPRSSSSYILENGKIKKANFLQAAVWFSENFQSRVVDKTQIGEVEVSTVFLSIDHNFWSSIDPRPILFETMIFGGDYDGCMWRWRTWGAAHTGHWKVADALRNKNPKISIDKLLATDDDVS